MPVLYLVGVGPSPRYISLEGLEVARKAGCLFGESYTTLLPREELAEVLGRELRWLSRRDLEDLEGREVVECAKSRGSAALLVGGDPLMATTHAALIVAARREGVQVRIVHGVSVLCAALSAACLSPYKLCGIATLTYPRMGVVSYRPYEVAERCLGEGLHTVLLLDVDDEGKFMGLHDAISILRKLEESHGRRVFSEDRTLIVVSRLGYGDQAVHVGRIGELGRLSVGTPITILVPGRLSEVEAECLSHLSTRRP